MSEFWTPFNQFIAAIGTLASFVFLATLAVAIVIRKRRRRFVAHLRQVRAEAGLPPDLFD